MACFNSLILSTSISVDGSFLLLRIWITCFTQPQPTLKYFAVILGLNLLLLFFLAAKDALNRLPADAAVLMPFFAAIDALNRVPAAAAASALALALAFASPNSFVLGYSSKYQEHGRHGSMVDVLQCYYYDCVVLNEQRYGNVHAIPEEDQLNGAILIEMQREARYRK